MKLKVLGRTRNRKPSRKGFEGGKGQIHHGGDLTSSKSELTLQVISWLYPSRAIKEGVNKEAGSIDNKQGGMGTDVPH